MKNLVLITSVIHTSSNPLSYSLSRSAFSPTERFIQTQKTIQSVRERIPEAKILLVECSVLTEEEETYFKTHCDYFINVVQEPNMLCWTTGLSKALGEGSMTIRALEYIQQQGFVFENLFKITGRYYLNDYFQYDEFDNESTCCKYANEFTVATLFYKIPFQEITYLASFFRENMEEMKQCVSFESIFTRFIQNTKGLKKFLSVPIGITYSVSVCGTVGEF